MLSLAGAAMKATSMGAAPVSMALGRPPWVRNSTGSSIAPSEIARPRRADM